MSYPLYDYGGGGPVIHFVGGNGFPPQTYRPLLDPLTSRYRVVSLLPRPLWPDPPPPADLTSWRQVADDLLAALHEHGFTDVIAAGHSMGGVCSMLAVLREPGRFRALVLLDPTLLPPPLLALIRLMGMLGLSGRFPLVNKALRRRNRFSSVEEAFEYWRAKPLFHGWPDETLRLYAESMTCPAEDGHSLQLAWSPTWEARFYQTILTDSWGEVPKLRGLLPVLVVRGRLTNTFVEASEQVMRHHLPEATYVTLEGHGHLFPHSAPDQTRQIVEEWLDAVL